MDNKKLADIAAGKIVIITGHFDPRFSHHNYSYPFGLTHIERMRITGFIDGKVRGELQFFFSVLIKRLKRGLKIMSIVADDGTVIFERGKQ